MLNTQAVIGKYSRMLRANIFVIFFVLWMIVSILITHRMHLFSWNPILPSSSSSMTSKNPTNDCLTRIGDYRGIQLYSQNDEDGALLQTLRCMGGHGTKEYFEFGSESGTEVNTRILRDLYGWHGHLLDGSNENPDINLHKEFITPQNIISLLEKYQVSQHLDVLSVDTDYDDFYILREILLAGYRPRVFLIEFNVNLGTDWSISTKAKPIGKEHVTTWQKDCYFGASALALINLSKVFRYTPVFSNNVNLIFVDLQKANNLEMMIPSVQNFPGPYAMAIHRSCSGKTWKQINENIVQKLASDSKVSHTDFANSFEDIKFNVEEYPDLKHGKRGWRIFKQVK